MTARDRYLQRVYGITEKQYNALFQKQKGRCAICLRKPEEVGRAAHSLCVDHDHISREIRGLLCNYCNRRVIGRHRRDKAGWYLRAYEYLIQGTNLYVPEKKKKRKK